MFSADDKEFLQSFENCSLGATCWTHAAHVRIGWLILESSKTFEEALNRIRSGIMKFNSTQNSIGYHETITVAFARIIDSRRRDGDTWDTFSQRNLDLFQKNCLENFYNASTLSSDDARKSFVEADRQKLPERSHSGRA
jgi:hypothetical protein